MRPVAYVRNLGVTFDTYFFFFNQSITKPIKTVF